MSISILAQAVAPNQTLLGWVVSSLGWADLLAMASGLLVFAGACYLIATKQRPAVIAAYMVFLPLPLMITIFGSLKGMIASFTVIAASANLEISTADYAAATSQTLLGLFAAMLVSMPTYLLLSAGLLARTMQQLPDRTALHA